MLFPPLSLIGSNPIKTKGSNHHESRFKYLVNLTYSLNLNVSYMGKKIGYFTIFQAKYPIKSKKISLTQKTNRFTLMRETT